ncbi:MAG: gliding motility-associated C-terminal domain-containing protein [Saprospiraceae bacterium]|nr:gliding motility-associated C-terminal domain-containing protein [Saprospiraceae bacterium]
MRKPRNAEFTTAPTVSGPSWTCNSRKATSTSLCFPASTVIAMTPPCSSGISYTYQWSSSDPSVAAVPAGAMNFTTASSINVSAVGSGTADIEVIVKMQTTLTFGGVPCPVESVLNYAFPVVVNSFTATAAPVDATFCAGASFQLMSSAGSTRTWSGPGGYTSSFQNPTRTSITTAMSGTYCVTVTAVSGCKSTSCVVITVGSNPTAVAGPNVTACSGADITLNSSGAGLGGSYNWGGPSGFSSSDQNPIISGATTSNSGIYTVTVTNAAGCRSTSTMSVTIQNIPNAAINGSLTLCAGASLNLTATGGGTYAWSSPPGGATAVVTVSPVSNTDYTVTVTNGGCTSTASVSVTITPPPTAMISGNLTICNGESTQLTATGGTNYTWSSPPGGAIDNITVNPITNTTYTVTVTDNGCKSTSSVRVVVKPLPTATIAGNLTICEGQSTILTAGGGGTYEWEDNSTTNPRTVSPTTTTQYTVSVTNNGCTSVSNVQVTVRPIPVAAINGSLTLCAGASLNLTATGGGTYAWSSPPGGATAAVTVSPSVDTDYTVTVTNGGCTSTASVSVTITPPPTAMISGNLTICNGESTQLTASGGTNYTWSSPPGGAIDNITVNPVTNTTYTVTVTDDGCKSTSSVRVVVKPLPTATIAGNLTICEGQSTILTAGGGGTYEWEDNSTTNPRTVSPTTTTQYTVSVTNNGCTSVSNVLVTVRPIPVAAINGSLTLCAGASLNLTATGGGTYAWSSPPGGATAVVTVSPSVDTDYTVTVTNGGCTSTASVSVTITPPPTAMISGNLTICNGESTQLTATGGTNYTWSSPPGGAIDNITVNPITNTTYTVTVTDNGCKSTSSVRVVVKPLPTATIAGNLTICEGQSTILTAGGGGTYEWEDNSTTNPRTVSPTTTTQYTVSVTNNGCTSVSNVQVTVRPIPVAAINGSLTLCAGASLNLTATGGGTYAWSSPPGGATAVVTVSPVIDTDYTVTVTNGGCTSTASVSVTITPPPTAMISGNLTICNGESTQLTATGGINYTWSSPPGGAIDNITVNPVTNTTYTVTVTDNGCKSTSSVVVVVKPLPTATIAGNLTICEGQSTILTAGGGGTYEWEDNSTTNPRTVSPTTTTQYTVSVTNNGCTSLSNVQITVRPIPVAAINGSLTLCAGASLNLTATGGGTYAWSSPPGGATAVVTVSPVINSDYTVTVTNGGCTSTASVSVTITPPPTAMISGNLTICNGESTQLTATGGTNYTWSSPPGGAIDNITVNPITNTTYTVTVTDNGCKSTSSVVVVVKPLPTATIAGNLTICEGQSTILTAGGGGTYEWEDNSTTNPRTVSPTTTTQYTVSVTNNGCTSVSNVLVTVRPIPVAAINGSLTLCAGASLNLTATGGGTYAWSSPPGGATAVVTVSPVSNTDYTVTVTNGGCTSTASVSVTITPPPTAMISGNLTICNGESTQLTATGGINYTWSSPPGGAIDNITVNPITNTTYTVTVTDNGCKSTSSVVVVVKPLPTATIAGNLTICEGQSTILTAGGGGTYEWEDNSTTNPRTVSPIVNTTYIVTVSGSNGCKSSTSIIVRTTPNPIANISGNANICTGQSTTLTATGGTGYAWSTPPGGASPTVVVSPVSDNTYTVTVTNGTCNSTSTFQVLVSATPMPLITGNLTFCVGETATLTGEGGISYTWSNSVTAVSINVNPIINTSYTVTVTNGICQATTSALVVVRPKPTATIAGNLTICEGQSSILTAGGGGTYEWEDNSTTNPRTVSPLTNTQYTVSVTNNGCTSVSNIQVTVRPIPVAAINGNLALCSGASSNLTATGGSGYAWSVPPGGNTAVVNISPLSNTDYTVTVTNNGCTSTTSVSVVVTPTPIASISGDLTICNGETSELTANGGVGYSWSTPPGGNANPINVTPLITTTYTVTVTDNGCRSTASVTLVVNNNPNLSIVFANTRCGGDNGSINVSVNGGVPNYNYIWNGPQVIGNISNPTNLQSGIYNLTVTDAKNCKSERFVTIGGSNPLEIDVVPTQPTCGLNNGSIQINVNQGTPNYNYSIGGAFSNNNTYPNLAPGNYPISVVDGTGCQAFSNINLNISSGINASLAVTNTTCGDPSNGQITITATGGLPNYEYLFGGNVLTNPIITGIGVGSHNVTITDAQGCIRALSFNIGSSTGINITGNSTQAGCSAATGSITVTGSNGTAPYTYVLGGNTTSTTGLFQNLGSGTYIIEVTDKNQCTSSIEIVVTSPNGFTGSVNTTSAHCNQMDGALSINLVGGLAPFSYVVNDVTQSSGLFTNLSPGAYDDIQVIDANGCSINLNAVINNINGPTGLVNLTHTSCNLTNGIININATGGTNPYTYTISGTNTSNTTGIFSSLGAGAYTVTITDSKSCTSVINTMINPSVNISARAITSPAACGTNSGSITVTPIGGVIPFNYSLNNGPSSSSNIFQNLSPNTYSVQVIDGNNCSISLSVTVPNSNGPNTSTSFRNATCNLDNGSINISATGGTFTYTFSGNGLTPNNNGIFTNVAPGIYFVTTTDGNSCSVVDRIEIVNIAGPSSGGSASAPKCGLDNGSITVTPTGGTTPYTYQISPMVGTQTSNVFTNLPPGNYTITITDNNNCIAIDFIPLVAQAPPSIIVMTKDALCNGANGSLVVNASSGLPPYLYSIGGVFSNSNEFTNLLPGTYTVSVTDFSNCLVTSTVLIGNTNPLVLQNSVVVQTSCGQNNGSIAVNVSNGQMPYNYNFGGGNQGLNTTSGLGAGNYAFTVTDNLGCSLTGQETISPSSGVAANANITPSSCGINNGSATVLVTQGISPYTYNISGTPQAGNVFSGLGAGTYVITVTDNSLCQTFIPVNIPSSSGLSASISHSDDRCSASVGSITIAATGTNTPIRYNIGSGNVLNPIFANLTSGTYTVTVTDNAGCTILLNTQVNNVAGPTAVSGTSLNTSCGLNNGSITLSAIGGTLPYMFSIGAGFVSSNVFGNLPSGNYTISVRDANNCTFASTTNVLASSNVTYTSTIDSTNCSNNSGRISINALNGTSPYNFYLGAAAQSNAVSAVFNGLASGNHFLTITDNNGCQILDTLTVPMVAGFSANVTSTVTSCGANNGSIIVTVQGGLSPFSYTIGGASQSSNIFNNLSAGNYIVTTTDQNGCVQINPVSVLSSSGLSISLTTANVKCGGANGSISVSINGGSSPYSIDIFPVITIGPPNTYLNVGAGTYTITVTDVSGCSVTQVATILNNPGPTNLSLAATPTSCGNSNGVIMATITGGTSPFLYSIPTALNQSIGTFNNLASGSYDMTVTDANGCQIIRNTSIAASQAIVLSSLLIDSTSCIGNDGKITVNVSNASPPIRYALGSTVQIDNPIFNNLGSGNYNLSITDGNGCTFIQNNILVPARNAPIGSLRIDSTTCMQSNGTITVNMTSGGSPFRYSIIPGTFSASNVFNNLATGQYTVTIVDNNNCTITLGGNISAKSKINIEGTVVTNVSTTGAMDGSANISLSNPNHPVSYVWSFNGSNVGNSTLLTGNNINMPNLAAGQYAVTVTDRNGCTSVTSFTLTEPSCGLAATVVSSNISCNGLANGAFAMNIVGANLPLTYTWTGPTAIGNTNTANNLRAGLYSGTLTDAALCKVVVNFTITEPLILKDTLIQLTNNLCASTCLGAINVSAVGGTPSYQYIWSTGSPSNAISNLCSSDYTVTITDGNGCKISKSFTITGTAPIQLNCSQLAPATTFGGIEGIGGIVVTGGVPLYSIAYSGPISNVLTGQGANISITGLKSGQYSITVTDMNGCTAICGFNIANLACNLRDSVILSQSPTCFGLSNGAITISGSRGTPPYSYIWGDNNINPARTGLPAGRHYYTITDVNSCVDSGYVNLTNPLPISFTKDIDSLDCTGRNIGRITYTNFSGGSGIYSYAYAPSKEFKDIVAGTVILSNLGENTYVVVLKDGNGCEFYDTTTLIKPTGLDINLPSVIEIESGDEVLITALYNRNPNEMATWLWMERDSIIGGNFDNITRTPFASTTIRLKGTDIYGCMDFAIVNIVVKKTVHLYIPNSFSPNGDGINDRFKIYGNDKIVNADYMRIFDRWGNMVYEEKDFKPLEGGQNGWSGYFKNSLMNPAVFVYTIRVTYNDGTKVDFVGDLTLTH